LPQQKLPYHIKFVRQQQIRLVLLLHRSFTDATFTAFVESATSFPIWHIEFRQGYLPTFGFQQDPIVVGKSSLCAGRGYALEEKTWEKDGLEAIIEMSFSGCCIAKSGQEAHAGIRLDNRRCLRIVTGRRPDVIIVSRY